MTPPHEPGDDRARRWPARGVHERPRRLALHPRYTPPSPPQAEVAALREAAKLLVNAENPVIVADRAARTPNGVKLSSSLRNCCNAGR